ncbi:RNA recognition motif protein [Ceratobasidium sp. AG-Ba]|nr:RNA recognition motif protein [Ceratobasidium sp. AG-Ba]
MPALMHPPTMPYWSPSESHAETMPLLYYDPGYGQYMFPPQHPTPYQPVHFAPQAPPSEPHVRFPHSQLHPQAPPFVPSGLVKSPVYPLEPPPAPTPVPAPRAPQLDPLAQALRRTMPKVRTHRVAPGERRPAAAATEGMDPSNMSDKFIYVEGVPRDVSSETLRLTFERCGVLRGIYVRLQAELGMVVLAYYDSRHAASALSQLQATPDQYFEGMTISARIPSYAELTQLLPNSPIVTECDSRVYITLVGQTTSLGPHMQSLLATYGDMKMFRVVGMHYKARQSRPCSGQSLTYMQVFHVEFFDVRDSTRAIVTLNNHKIHGAVAHLSTSPNSNVVPSNSVVRDVEDSELSSLIQTTDLNVDSPEEHAYIEGLPLPRSDSSPITPDRARFGRRASTGSAFPSPIGRSASQSSDNLAEQVSGLPGVPFPSYPDTFDDQDQLPQEHTRRRSVAHSFDSASASSASLSFKYACPPSPDRTISTAPTTPAGTGRRISLPPFQGPLPVPSTNQWTSPAPDASDDDLANTGELDGFITVRASQSTSSLSSGSRSTLGSSHMCLPASARAVLDLLRDPPPERNRVDVQRIEAGLDTRTTIMLKNIPNKMSTKNLIDFIDAVTPRAIDFLYLRFDFQNECNVGYAFVNFMNISDLLKFMKARLGRKWNMYASEKVLGAGYANYQGKEALIEKFKNSSIMDTRPVWRPRIFYSSGEHIGLPEPFPSPTGMRRVRRSITNGANPPSGGLFTQMHHNRNQPPMKDTKNPASFCH